MMTLPWTPSSRALPGRLQRALFSSGRPASDGRQLPSGVPPLRILHHSPGLVVVHKPVGLVAQGGADHARLDRGEATLEQHLNELSRRLARTSPSPGSGASTDGPDADEPHGIRTLHRLDKDVEGPLVLALTQARAKEVARQFQRHEVVKTYYALVSRYIPASERPPLLPTSEAVRSPTTHFSVVSPTGLVSAHPGPATSPSSSPTASAESPSFGLGPTPTHAPRAVHASQTAWAFLGGSPALGLSLVRLHPVSGRKHQLRVFCADILGAPIVGDALYGYVSPTPELARGPTTAGAREGGRPPRPTDETPLFLKCTALGLTVRSAGGRPRSIVVRGLGAHEGGWAGVREWLDEWVGEPPAELASASAGEEGAGGSGDDEVREARERARMLERRAARQAAKKAKSAKEKEERKATKAAAADVPAASGEAAGG